MTQKHVWEASAALRAAGLRLNESGEGRGPAGGDDSREAAASSAAPPGGNTGGKFTTIEIGEGFTVKIDWLSVVFPEEKREAVREEVSRYLGSCEFKPRGIHGYQKCWVWEHFGAVLTWSDGRHDALLSMNGRSVDQVHVSQQLHFLKALEEIGVRCSRLDIALDDHKRRIEPDDVEREFEAGHVVGYRLGTPHRPKRRVKGQTLVEGASFELGRRGADGSGKFLVVYDKTLESDGEIDAIRWELRFSKEAADTAFLVLSSSRDLPSLSCKLTRYVGGAVDFRSSPHLTNLSRRPRLAWWEYFVGILGAAELKVPRQRPPLQQSIEWVRRSLAPLLGKAELAIKVNGGDAVAWFLSLVREGQQRADLSRVDVDGIDVQACMGEREKWPDRWTIPEVAAAVGLAPWAT